MFESFSSLNKYIIYFISWCLIGAYYYWIITYQEANLWALILPILLTFFLTIYLAFILRKKYPSSWRNHPTMVLSSMIVGQAIGLLVAMYFLFIFPG
jgi:small-conductance mechanosensitive channel